MKAVVIATDIIGDDIPSSAPTLGCMMPVMDRPILQHLIERLTTGGVETFEMIISQSPERIRRLLGDGSRWGVTIAYHLVRDGRASWEPIPDIAGRTEHRMILIGRGDTLPPIDLQLPDENGPILFFRPGADGTADSARHWSGWAWLPTPMAETLPRKAAPEDLLTVLKETPGCRSEIVESPGWIACGSYIGLLAANRTAQDKRIDGLMHTASEVEDRVWLSRNVRIHPTADIVSPVFIGENVSIGKGCRIGPYATLGTNCVIDDESAIENSVVLPGSYIGAALEVTDAVVNRNRLVNTRLGASLVVSEAFILGSLSRTTRPGWIRQKLAQIWGAALLIAFFPVLAAAGLITAIRRKGPLISRRPVVQLPADGDPALWRDTPLIVLFPGVGQAGPPTAGIPVGWKHFIFRFVPALINVARGGIRLVGLAPRGRDEIQALSGDWRELYLQGKAGVVTEALVMFGPDPTEDELYAAEAVYAVSGGWRHDLSVMGRYIGQVLGLIPPPHRLGDT